MLSLLETLIVIIDKYSWTIFALIVVSLNVEDTLMKISLMLFK